MKADRLFAKIIPAIFVAVPLLNALIIFIFTYMDKSIAIPLIVNTDEETNRLIFRLNFYVLFMIYTSVLFFCLFCEGFFAKGICLLMGFVSGVISVYMLDNLFIVKFFVYLAYIIMVSLVFSPIKSIIAACVSIFLFSLFLYHPAFMGLAPDGSAFINPSPVEIIPLIMMLSLVSASMILLHLLFNQYVYNKDTIKHLDSVGTRMVLFNHRLQELAKQRGEEAVKQDRLRFTRDLHDSCGYAFTNIIMVSDAAVSQGQTNSANTQEIFHNIRKLALNGLEDTRETLHLIRKIQEPYARSIDTVHQIKTIFEEVSGIDVVIEWGNMRHEYGLTVNEVLTRIIQEAFTNSIRHGKASRIMIQFWEFPRELSMTVTDNGLGAADIVKGIGLVGMEERLAAVGGRLVVSIPQEGGFRLKIIIPIIGRGFTNGTNIENTAGG